MPSFVTGSVVGYLPPSERAKDPTSRPKYKLIIGFGNSRRLLTGVLCVPCVSIERPTAQMPYHDVYGLLFLIYVFLGSYTSAITVISNSQLQACVQDGTVRCLSAPWYPLRPQHQGHMWEVERSGCGQLAISAYACSRPEPEHTCPFVECFLELLSA